MSQKDTIKMIVLEYLYSTKVYRIYCIISYHNKSHNTWNEKFKKVKLYFHHIIHGKDMHISIIVEKWTFFISYKNIFMTTFFAFKWGWSHLPRVDEQYMDVVLGGMV